MRWRTRSSTETVAAVSPLMPGLGIEGLTGITALDRLGWPVWVSLRPQGIAAGLHAGRGLTEEDASGSALMEAIECAVAEQASGTHAYERSSLGALEAGLPDGLTWADFSPRLDAELDPQREVIAVRCTDLLRGAQISLPAELVMVPPPRDTAPPLFGWSSNGLAAGSSVEEATLHALLEILERDTLTFALARGLAVHVDPTTLPAALADRARGWARAGVELHVRHLPGDFDLPCFEATLHEAKCAQAPLARGWGLHVDRRAALHRAIGEAAQARLCMLHSGLPGMASHYRGRLRGADASVRAMQRFRQQFGSPSAAIDFDAVAQPDVASLDSIRAGLAWLSALLPSRGFRHVFRFVMPASTQAEQAGVHVVKLVAPGCEHGMGTLHRAGPRLRALAAAMA